MAIKTAYLALALGTATGIVLAAQRTYQDKVHAQLANPEGTLYEVQVDEDAETVEVYAKVDSSYPLTLVETRVPGIGANAEGAITLRDLGGGYHRWVVHFRNDQCGGHHDGTYCRTITEALEAFAARSARELKRAADRFRLPVEA